MKNIEHVVVLMLENRSFDSMLGWLYEKGQPAHNVPDLKPGERAYEGLQGLNLKDFENVDATGTIKVDPIRGVQGLNVPNTAPGEDFEQVTTQLFGSEKPAPAAKPTMKGYVRDYTNLMRKHGYDADAVKRYAQQVMQSHTPAQAPVLNGLAEHYAVCDMWFSSVPSQTNPNRAFAFCGTSMGLADNGFLEENPLAPVIEKAVGYKLGDDRFKAKTIFNALADAGATWKVFRESGMLQNNLEKMSAILLAAINVFVAANPWAIPAGVTADTLLAYLVELSSSATKSGYVHRLFPEILKIKGADSHFGMLGEFHSAARAGRLPHFTFIEPEWTIGERGTGETRALQKVLFHQGHDYHPPGNTDAGENLVKQVYLSLIANQAAWEKTLLLITFDEPVGAFDHVPPPAAIPPWGEGKAPAFPLEHDFKFDRYGGRVPTIVVSPWVKKGTVFRSTTQVPFDHTSLIATILKWKGLENRIADFGERTKHTPTFENIVSLSAPRTDAKEVPFLKLGHKKGDPVRYYDRFLLRAPNGQYISKFEEDPVAPWSLFSDDSALSEYFPTLAYGPGERPPTQFYLQNAGDRPDEGEVKMGAGARLNAVEDGLGSYNVLGAWKDSHDCYYSNDYMEGDNSRKQTWKLANVSGANSLRFGDRVRIQNQYFEQRLAPDSAYRGYVTTNNGDAHWTVEPIPDEMKLDRWGGGITGVLLAGGFRTQQQMYTMSAEDRRNTLITVLGARTAERGCQALNDADLAGAGASLVYLRGNRSRTDEQIKTMTADDMRNIVIIEVGGQTHRPDLQDFTNMGLVQLMLEPSSYIRGVLLVGKFRTQQQMYAMSPDDLRNTLITELNARTKDRNYQSYNDADLAGVGGLLVYLRGNRSRTDEQIKTMTADDMRNIVIVEIGGRPDLQGLSNITLVQLLLEPGADTLHRGDEYYLKHVASGRYVTETHRGDQWWPTLGASAGRVTLRIPAHQATPQEHDGMPIVEGSALEIISTENLVSNGKRCDVLMAWTNPNLYYYYGDYKSPQYRTWIVSRVDGPGLLRSGNQVRLINKGYDAAGGTKALMAPHGGYLTTVSNDSKDCLWVLEKAPRNPKRFPRV